MKHKIHVSYKTTSLVMAICFFTFSCFTFNGCNYGEEHSDMKEDYQIPQVVENNQLPLSNELIINLMNSLTEERESKNFLKSAFAEKIIPKFGEPEWEDNQLVTYDNGLKGLYIPLVKNKKITGFILSKPDGNRYKTIIIELLPEKFKKDKAFSGKINFYTTSGVSTGSYSYINGKYISKFKITNSQTTRLKSGTSEGDCNPNCVYNCFNNIMTSDWLYSSVCFAACLGCETGIGLFMCIFCIGGPALTCLEQCCPGTVVY